MIALLNTTITCFVQTCSLLLSELTRQVLSLYYSVEKFVNNGGRWEGVTDNNNDFILEMQLQ